MTSDQVEATSWPGLPIEYRPVYPGAGNGPRTRKAAEDVARRLVDDLIHKGYGVGDRFPSEADMLREHGVSRETLREGLRLLEVQGLITIRRGPGGGPFVSAVNAAHLAQSASLFFNVSGSTYREAFEAWALLEPAIIRKIAGMADRRRIEVAMRPFAEGARSLPADDAVEYFHEATGFHAVLSQLASNRVLVLLTQAIEHIVTDRVVRDVDVLRVQQEIEHDHIALAGAILRGHTRRAEELAAAHIRGVQAAYEAHAPGQVDEVVVWR